MCYHHYYWEYFTRKNGHDDDDDDGGSPRERVTRERTRGRIYGEGRRISKSFFYLFVLNRSTSRRRSVGKSVVRLPFARVMLDDGLRSRCRKRESRARFARRSRLLRGSRARVVRSVCRFFDEFCSAPTCGFRFRIFFFFFYVTGERKEEIVHGDNVNLQGKSRIFRVTRVSNRLV